MQKLSKGEIIAVGVAVAVVAYFFFLNKKEEIAPTAVAPSEEVKVVEKTEEITSTNKQTAKQIVMTDATELKVQIVKEGTGEPAAVGDIVEVNYTGRLTDGTVFDSSIPRGKTFDFRLGEGRVIAGWEEGVKGMKVGEKRVLTIPGNMAYGSQGVPNGQGGYVIPPNATLIFEVDLISIK